ncbi:MAG: caspase family protein, partial [Syntrophales bacterium]|nr:caspase family protein [Syntrophales bacterium]
MHPCPIARPLALVLAALLYAAAALPLCAQTVETIPASGGPLRPGEPLLTIESGLHAGSLRSLSTDREGRWLVTGSSDKTVRIWNLPSGNPAGIIRPPIGRGGDGIINAVAISPDGSTIACGGRTREAETLRTVYLFDRESLRMLNRVRGLPENVVQLQFSRDGRVLAVGLGGTGGGLRLYAVSRKGDRVEIAQLGREQALGGAVRGLDMDRAGRVAATTADGALRLYSKDLRLLAEKELPKEEAPSGVRFSPDGKRIAMGYFRVARVDVFAADDLKRIATPDVPRTRAQGTKLLSVEWSPDGRYLYASGWYAQRARNVILRWPVENFDTPDMLPSARALLHNIRVLRGGGIVYGAVNGDMGHLDATGREIFVKSPNLDHYSGKAFSISQDAMTVRFDFLQDRGVPAQFSVETKQLELSPMPALGMLAPVLQTDGFELTDWLLKFEPKLNGKPLPMRYRDQGTSYAIVPDRRSFLYGMWWGLYRFDMKGKELWFCSVPGAVRALNVSRDGSLAVAGVSDGTIRWYRMEDGRELAAFYPHSDRKRWVLWTPSGYYDASEGGDELIGWHVNNGLDRAASFYPVSRFFERFYRPEVVARAVKAVEDDTAVIASLGEKEAPSIETAGIRPPPEAAIVSPLPGKQFDSDMQEIKVIAEDLGGGIGEVRLYQNGKILPREAAARVTKEGSTQEHLFRVKLIDGENRLKVVALSRDRIEGSPMEMTVTLRGAGKESDLHLLVVGINRYRNAALNLTYAETDAKGVLDFFQSADVKKLFKDIRVYSAMSEQATGPAIRGLFAEAARKAQPQDTLLIYLAGHGDTVADEWYFIPHDVTAPEIEQELKKGGISNGFVSESIKQCRAQKVFVMIDACKSGRLVLAMRSTEARKALVQLAR